MKMPVLANVKGLFAHGFKSVKNNWKGFFLNSGNLKVFLMNFALSNSYSKFQYIK